MQFTENEIYVFKNIFLVFIQLLHWSSSHYYHCILLVEFSQDSCILIDIRFHWFEIFYVIHVSSDWYPADPWRLVAFWSHCTPPMLSFEFSAMRKIPVVWDKLQLSVFGWWHCPARIDGVGWVVGVCERWKTEEIFVLILIKYVASVCLKEV